MLDLTHENQNQKIDTFEKFTVITERVDDIALLIGQMNTMGLREVLDNHIPKHHKQRELSWGWTAVIWLAYIISEGDHRKVSVESYVGRMQNTLSQLTGQNIEPLDFSDDRLTNLLKHLSKREYWYQIEQELNERSIEVFELTPKTIRCDTTTVSGNHKVVDGGLMQFGHSKDKSGNPQMKLMSGALDPLGMPLASDGVSGEKADDGLYIPLIDRINMSLGKTGLLFIGDCKMSALAIRFYLVCYGHYYLSPLPLTGGVAEEMEAWISEGIMREQAGSLELVFKKNEKEEEIMIASGYEFEREQKYFSVDDKEITWKERVLVIHSPTYAERQAIELEKRLVIALQKITALTPPRGKGKRQIIEEKTLLAAIDQILETQRVKGLLKVEYERQCEYKIKYVGKGRGSSNREKRVEEKVRYQITTVVYDNDKITAQKKRFGWKAFVTNVALAQLSLSQSVLNYRDEYRVERIFNRLKNRLEIAPLFLKLDNQIEGLTYLLTLGVRVLTLTEFVLRRSLQENNAKLPNLHQENHQKMTDKPTAERILKAFANINLTIICDVAGNVIFRHLTQLSSTQIEILQRLGLDAVQYLQLETDNYSLKNCFRQGKIGITYGHSFSNEHQVNIE